MSVPPRRYKRLCLFSDGTWASPESPILSNIVKLAKAILPEDAQGVQQVLFYDDGLGTNGPIDRILGGGFGEGIDRNIKQLYTFLALNYEEGDEVYLFGYSRGAYTIRSLTGLIHKAGLVRRPYVDFVEEAYQLYRKKLPVDDPEAVAFREEHGEAVPVRLVTCFDTVGSLGLPDNVAGPFAGMNRRLYEFHDLYLHESTEHAIHALSIDEDGKSFEPTRMKPHKKRGPDQLTELFFYGRHGGVGGAEATELESGKTTLRFVLDEIKKRQLPLEFNNAVLPSYEISRSAPGQRGPISHLLQFITGRHVRKIVSRDELHFTAKRRYQMVESWRPDSLKNIERTLLEWVDDVVDEIVGAVSETVDNVVESVTREGE